jgi:hypothetical protein
MLWIRRISSLAFFSFWRWPLREVLHRVVWELLFALLMGAVSTSETKVNFYQPAYTAQHPRRQLSSYSWQNLNFHLFSFWSMFCLTVFLLTPHFSGNWQVEVIQVPTYGVRRNRLENLHKQMLKVCFILYISKIIVCWVMFLYRDPKGVISWCNKRNAITDWNQSSNSRNNTLLIGLM